LSLMKVLKDISIEFSFPTKASFRLKRKLFGFLDNHVKNANKHYAKKKKTPCNPKDYRVL